MRRKRFSGCDRSTAVRAAAVVMVGEDTQWLSCRGNFTNGSAVFEKGGVMLPLTAHDHAIRLKFKV